MTQKQDELLKLYAEKKAAMKQIESDIEELEAKVLSFLDKQGVDTLKEPYGTFSVVYRKKWSYTPELLEKEKEYKSIIKQKQNDEQSSGEASYEESKGLSYRAYEE